MTAQAQAHDISRDGVRHLEALVTAVEDVMRGESAKRALATYFAVKKGERLPVCAFAVGPDVRAFDEVDGQGAVFVP